MEMVSQIATAVAVLAFSGAAFTFALVRSRRQVEQMAKNIPTDLAQHETRVQLTAFMQKHGVYGSADIRDGVVYPPVAPDRLEPLAVVLGNAAAMIGRLRNPAAASLYVRDSVNDKFMLLADLDIDHLLDAARVMQRVAEDRRKSRSLYKGLTDEELRAMVRAGMSQWYKDNGKFDASNHVMQGLRDDTDQFQMIVRVIDLLFKVKGASNG